MKQIPQIREVNGIQTLYVDDEPFFILGGEIHNSASSSLSSGVFSAPSCSGEYSFWLFFLFAAV